MPGPMAIPLGRYHSGPPAYEPKHNLPYCRRSSRANMTLWGPMPNVPIPLSRTQPQPHPLPSSQGAPIPPWRIGAPAAGLQNLTKTPTGAILTSRSSLGQGD